MMRQDEILSNAADQVIVPVVWLMVQAVLSDSMKSLSVQGRQDADGRYVLSVKTLGTAVPVERKTFGDGTEDWIPSVIFGHFNAG